MRKVIIFILILLILLPDSAKAQKDWGKLRLPAKAVSGLFAYLSDVVVEDGDKGDKVSIGDAPSEVSERTLVLSDYYLIKFTAKWCGGCKVWDRGVRKSLKAIGVNTVEIDVDERTEFNGMTLPTVWICTRVDNKYHPHLKAPYAFVMPSHNQVISAIAEIDKELHPTSVSDVADVVSEARGVRYVRQSTQTWNKIDGVLNPSREVYLTHLKHEVKHKAVKDWPLDELTLEELKAIHDDSHNGKLGKLLEKN